MLGCRAPLALSLVLAACSGTPSVESLTETHRDAIVAHIERVRAIRDQLASAPEGAPGIGDLAGTLTHDNTVTIVERDFDALRTDRQTGVLDHHDWTDASTATPYSSSDLAGLVDAVRAIPGNPPDTTPHQIEALERRIAAIPGYRYVAVVRADEARASTAGAGRFTPAYYRGRLLVWDLQAQRWVGAVSIEVEDHRARATSGSTDVARDVNASFNQALVTAVSSALTSGHDVHTAR